MKILILTASHPFKAAGIVAYDLLKGLSSIKGNDVRILVKAWDKYEERKIIPIETTIEHYFNAPIRLIKRIKKKTLKSILKGYKTKDKKFRDSLNGDYHIHDYDQTIQYYKTKQILKKVNFKPDIILYLFPQGFLNAKNLYELNRITGAPIFWYLMDPAALTGGCHFFWDCKRYLTGCGKCPAMYSDDENDQSAINFKYKFNYLNKTDIHIITGTEWQYQKAKESLLYKNKPLHKILLAIDHKIFKPISKIPIRKKLGISANKKIVFFGTARLNAKRKGMRYLVDALKLLQIKHSEITDNIFLLVAGNNFEYIKDDLPFEYKYLGMLENNEQLANAFQSADVFVCPSIEDSGPMMINQSIMSGCPVVAFKMGVAFDLVISGKTGYLAELKNIEDMAKGIFEILLLNNDELKKMVNNCRDMALQLYQPKIQIEKLEKIFDKVKERPSFIIDSTINL